MHCRAQEENVWGEPCRKCLTVAEKRSSELYHDSWPQSPSPGNSSAACGHKCRGLRNRQETFVEPWGTPMPPREGREAAAVASAAAGIAAAAATYGQTITVQVVQMVPHASSVLIHYCSHYDSIICYTPRYIFRMVDMLDIYSLILYCS